MLVQSDFSNTMDTNIVHPGILLPIVYVRECVCVYVRECVRECVHTEALNGILLFFLSYYHPLTGDTHGSSKSA